MTKSACGSKESDSPPFPFPPPGANRGHAASAALRLGHCAGPTYGEFFELIVKTTKPSTEKLPVFRDEALRRLTMPVLAIVGAKDALLDSSDTRLRIESLLQNGAVKYIDDAGHLIVGQGQTIADFLHGA